MADLATLPSRVERDADLALRRGQQRLLGILDTAGEAFVAFDADGLILDWNAAAARTFGLSRGEALGRQLGEMLELDPSPLDGQQRLMEFLAREATPKAPSPAPFTVQARHRDGHAFPATMAACREAAGSGHIWHAFVRDVARHQLVERERQDAHQQLAHDALHDGLTGVANRALLMDRIEGALERAGRQSSLVAVLFADLDRFRQINEMLGHDEGDRLLMEVAARITGEMRNRDIEARAAQTTIARIGTEFVLVCEDIGCADDAAAIAERLARCLTAPLVIAAEHVRVSASIGIALATEASTPQSLLRDADLASSRAKERGGARHEIFDEALRRRVSKRQRGESELRRAIEENELCVFYQPILTSGRGALAAAEALVRWQHPQRGLLAPGEFLPLAEERGMMVDLGRWVLGAASEQAREWQALRHAQLPLPITVNVSPQQLTQENAATLLSEIGDLEIDPALLALEITESGLLRDGEEPIDVLADLRDLGVKILLDDFGTGYSSLSYLHRLPLDAIKLDRGFIAAITEMPVKRDITRAIIQLADALGLSVVAEGVETPEQVDCLEQLGCPFLQGYYFARPMTAQQFTTHILQEPLYSGAPPPSL